MFASVDANRASGDWLFPLAFQKCKNVDTHINKKKERKRQEHPMKMTGKIDFIL